MVREYAIRTKNTLTFPPKSKERIYHALQPVDGFTQVDSSNAVTWEENGTVKVEGEIKYYSSSKDTPIS